MSSSPPKYDVIIVGAGASGLAAARHLTHAGRRVLVLEARERIGGRIDTVEMGGGRFEMGASFVHGIHGNPLVPIAKKIGMKLHFPTEGLGSILTHTGATLPPELESTIAENAYSVLFSTLRHASQSSTPPPTTPISEPLFAPSSPLYANLPTEEAKGQAAALARAWSGWTGADLDRVSYRWWGFERDTQGPDGLVVSGYRGLVEWCAREVEGGGGEVRLGEEVVGVEVVEDEKKVVIKTKVTSSPATQNEYTAPYTLLTLPLGVLKARAANLFTPPLPPRRLDSLTRLSHGLLNKVHLLYPSAWWSHSHPNEHYFLLPDLSRPESLLGRKGLPHGLFVQNLWAIQRVPALLVFLGGSTGEALERLTDSEIHTWATGVIQQYFSPSSSQSPPPPAPVEVRPTRWLADPYALGSYCYIPPGDASPLDMVELSHPLWGRVFFAGEHTDPDEFASVHGAWNSGVREGRKLEVVLEAVGEEGEEE